MVTPQQLIQATIQLLSDQEIMAAKINTLQNSVYLLSFTTFILLIAIYKLSKK